MLFGTICALGSSVCFGMASVLQALGARGATPGTGAGVDVALQMRVMRQWRYPAGLSLDGIGFGLQVVALLTGASVRRRAPVAGNCSAGTTAHTQVGVGCGRLHGREWVVAWLLAPGCRTE